MKNITTRPRDLPIIIRHIITIDCVSSFCGLVHVEGLTYGHAMILHVVLSCGECINMTVTGVNLAKYCTKELGPDEDKDNLLKPASCIQLLSSITLYCHFFTPKVFFRGSKQLALPTPLLVHPHQDKELTSRNITLVWLLCCSLCFFYLFGNLF